jgi:hypothetical protein
MARKPTRGDGGLVSRPRKAPTRAALFKSKKFWKAAPASYYEKTGLSPLSNLSIPKHVKSPNKSTIAVPTKTVDALTKARGSKRQGFIEKLKSSVATAKQRLAPVSEQAARADKIVHSLTFTDRNGEVTAMFRGRSLRDKIMERNHAMWNHFHKSDDSFIDQWKVKYGSDYAVTDIHGKSYTIIIDPDQLSAVRSRMTKKQLKKLDQRYETQAA